MKSSVIDCHAQWGSGESWARPRTPVDYSLDILLTRAAEAGIEQSCIMAPRNDSYEEQNKKVARLCEKHPESLIGFAVHSPQREKGRLKQLLGEEVKAMGLKGVKSDGHPTRELLDVVAEFNIPVIYYPDPDDGINAGRMYHNMAMAYPRVNFIIPHLGSFRSLVWWAHMETIDLVKRYPNVFAETSGIVVHDYLKKAAQELPADKILFGSYAPELDPRVETYAVKLLSLPGPQEARVLGGNIRHLLG
jgi:predicted TIM-barrel fold metal-dependent hydrolase